MKNRLLHFFLLPFLPFSLPLLRGMAKEGEGRSLLRLILGHQEAGRVFAGQQQIVGLSRVHTPLRDEWVITQEYRRPLSQNTVSGQPMSLPELSVMAIPEVECRTLKGHAENVK